MKNPGRTHLAFFLPYGAFLAAGAVLMSVNTKAHTHLFSNSLHTPFLDAFFREFTVAGDGWAAVIVVLLLAFVQYRYSVATGVAVLLSSGIVQILKQFVFADTVRPRQFFEGVHDLYIVPGTDPHLFHSFPSGHSACGFALYLSLALLTRNRLLQFTYFLVALLAAYSRVYLSQHFLEDIYAGSVIAIIVTLPVHSLISKSRRPWLDGSLLASSRRS